MDNRTPDIKNEDNGEEVTRRTPRADFTGVSLLDSQAGNAESLTVGTTATKPLTATGASTSTSGPRPGSWALESCDVPTLPTFYPLERTARFVPHESPAAITGRISAELRDRSIEAVFEENKAKCTTAEGVEFRIKLFRGRNQFANGTIVEVQRRFGVSTQFYGDTMAILQRAEAKDVDVPRKADSDIPLVSETGDSYEADGASSLKMVAKMLKPEGHDAQSLGLQTLASLTDKKKMGDATASAICKELVKPLNEVGSKVLSILKAPVPSNGEEHLKVRSLAFQVLANTVQGCAIDENLQSELEPIIVEALQNSSTNQRNAFLAAKCVEFMKIKDCREALEEALRVGEERHTGLKKQALRCLGKV